MKIIATLIGLVIFQITFAQLPSLTIQYGEKKQDLEISQLNVNVNIVGNIATTTFDINFHNPFNRDLEGEFVIPLADGQEVCRYALEINGKLREGVVVEKIKARQTFEAVVRQKIDPGIANLTKGNYFKTKVFPIPSNGNKRIVLGLSETLSGDDEKLYYSLSAESDKLIGELKLFVKVAKNLFEETNIISEFENTRFDNQEDAYCLNFERNSYSFINPLKFTIPRYIKTNHQIFTCEKDGKTYFYLTIKPPKLKSFEKNAPRKITIYWDNSFSASKRNIDKELKFLSHYLASLKGIINVSLVTFNQKVSSPKTFSIKQNANELVNYIKQLKNDGATNLDKLIMDKDCNEIIFFSDAINTIGEDVFETSQVPIYSVSSNTGSNYSFLKRIANKTDGEFVNLNIFSLEEALEIMHKDEEKFLSCNYNASEIEEVFPNIPTRVNDYFEIVGILKNKNATINVNYGYKSTITKIQTFEVSRTNNTPVSRIWASKKIESLESNYSENQGEILRLAQIFNIVTPNTAFIVLDRIQDYLQYNIVPPDELKEEYHKLQATAEKATKLTPKVIEERNSIRIKHLKSWYSNPVKYSQNEIEPEDNSNILFSINEDSEILPITRRAESEVPPPPPPNVSNTFNIVDDEVEFDEELDISCDDIPSIKSQVNSSIKVLAWLPDAPYMDILRNANPVDIDSLYFVLKEENVYRPSFYIQVADYFFKKKMTMMANRVLSNVLELDLENPELLKLVAKRFINEKEFLMAIEIYKEIKKLRPEEPQSYRDLALAYIENKEYQNALDEFIYILDNDWDRFEEIKDVVLNELNNLFALHFNDLNLNSVDSKYIIRMPLDIRITLDWSSNENDIDLWVIDPNGEKCFYGHSFTTIGGKISRDFTRGYGPEEFSLKIAKRGTYTVYVNYFGDSRQTISGPVTVYVSLFTNYGTEDQTNKNIAVQLTDSKETMQIGQLEFE